MKSLAPAEFVVACHSWQQAHHIADECIVRGLASGAEFIAVPGDQKNDSCPVQLVLQVAADKRGDLKSLMKELSIGVVESTQTER